MEVRQKRFKKGQAAMEFLMTYGWAILAAIIVIAVIAIYFRPSGLVSNQVIVNAPLYGVGVSMDGAAGTIDVEVRNNGGADLVLDNAAGLGAYAELGSCTTLALNPAGASIPAGDNKVLQFSGCGSFDGETVNEEVIIYYKWNTADLTRLKSTGSVSGRG